MNLKDRKVIFTAAEESGEIMIRWPDGQVEFKGWLSALWIMWQILRSGMQIEVTE